MRESTGYPKFDKNKGFQIVDSPSEQEKLWAYIGIGVFLGILIILGISLILIPWGVK